MSQTRSVDRVTVDTYEREAKAFAAARDPGRGVARARTFAERLRPGAVRVDLGCGPGFHTGALGDPVVVLDVARAMLDLACERAPSALAVQADLEHLPLRGGALGGVWAARSYVHVPAEDVPMAWHDLHRSMAEGAEAEIVVFDGDRSCEPIPDSDLPARRFSGQPVGRWVDLAVGAGFQVMAHEHERHEITLRLRALRSLADTVGPGMRLLVCGLNPSLHAADAGVGFVTGNNRFWPAALAAGLVSIDRDPVHALRAHRVGMTDLVKRATPRASELSAAEYRTGLERLDRMCAWLRPRAIVMVGLAGWRAATDRGATTGWQDRVVGGCPVYVMPSTSGLNAATSLDELTDHLREALTAAPPAGRPRGCTP